MTLDLILRCDGDGCEESVVVDPYFKLTKMGTLRLQAAPSGLKWYVDGGSVFCGGCVPEEKRDSGAQRETWGEYDRRSEELLDPAFR